jgi:hypothetical protein
MPVSKPYRDSYFAQKKKKTRILAAVSLVILALLGIIYVTSHDQISKIKTNEKNQAAQSTKPEKNNLAPSITTPSSPTEKNQDGPLDFIQENHDLSSQPRELSDSDPTKQKIVIQKKPSSREWISEVDQERERGLVVFEDVIRQCWESRERLTLLQSEYEANCRGTAYDAFGNVIDLSLTLKCQNLRKTIETLKIEIEKNLDIAQYQARKSGVYPGQIREILTKYGFDDQ